MRRLRSVQSRQELRSQAANLVSWLLQFYGTHRDGVSRDAFQSTFAPDALMIFAYFGISLFTNAANCSGVVGEGSAPCAISFSRISGELRILTTSAFHLVM